MTKKQRCRNIIIVKVGTSTLTQADKATGVPDLKQQAFQNIGGQIAKLHRQHDIVIVTSAAITAGMALCKLRERPSADKNMPALQRLASLGTPALLHAWQTALPEKRLGCLLLTRLSLQKQSEERSRALNVVIEHLTNKDIPIVNENDAIATEEIAYGDNDTLAAEIAVQLAAEGRCVQLVLLSDVDGVYHDPSDSTTLLHRIDNVNRLGSIAGESGTDHGTGGMRTKFVAARMVTEVGIDMYIVNGSRTNCITDALDHTAGTHFAATR